VLLTANTTNEKRDPSGIRNRISRFTKNQAGRDLGR
jgi:hypothetical protein